MQRVGSCWSAGLRGSAGAGLGPGLGETLLEDVIGQNDENGPDKSFSGVQSRRKMNGLLKIRPPRLCISATTDKSVGTGGLLRAQKKGGRGGGVRK